MFVAALAFVLAAPTAQKSLAVLDLSAKGVEADLAGNLSDVVTVSLSKLGVFIVLSRADIQRMLEFEQNRQAVGCDNDTSCLAEIGGALGVALLVTGSVGKVGSSYMINLTLVDTSAVTVLSREQRQVGSLEDLPAQVDAASRFLVRSLLHGQQGELIVSAAESEAEVEIDGRLAGVTPLGRQTLPGGPHTIKVHKKGFVSFARDVEVRAGEPVLVEAALVPSLELIAEHEETASSWRLAAYITGGAGLALLGFGVGGWIWNGDRIATYERNLRKNNCHADATEAPLTDCSRFAQRRATLAAYDPWVLSAMIVGSAAVATATFLFFFGPEPGVYDQFGASSALTFAFAPLADGGLASGRLAF